MTTHAHHSHASDYGRAFIIGIGLNVAFTFAEIAYGFQANSLALLADAGHNASDVLGLAMAWGATWLGRREASERFTYGLQSASIIAALANALLLLAAVGGIGWEAAQRLATPQAPAAGLVITVASVGVLVNGLTAWLFHEKDHHDLNLRGAFLHMAADAAISLGVVFSGLLIIRTGWLWLDPAVSLLIVLAIVFGTWQLLKESLSLALHAVPRHIDTAQVKAWLAGLEGVRGVHDLHIWAMSTTGVAMSAHLLMPDGHPGDAFITTVTHELQHRFRIDHATLQIELGDAAGCEGCGHP
ncbi:MAG: cation transporter [Pseudomonadota bacterium]|nr:cation transporter [Pseudomonadota bacterium]